MLSKYKQLLLPLDIKVYKFKYFLCIGFYILDVFKYKYSNAYDRKILMTISELYGNKNALFYLKIHWATKITLALGAFLFGILIGIISKFDTGSLIFCILLLFGIVYFTDKELYNKVMKRRREIQIDFPDFVNKLTLLINAGMTVTKAWEKVTVECNKRTPLYIELNNVIQDIKSGKPEQKAYEEFAKRCRTHEITRFVSSILQNIRKGNNELVPILRVFANDCWEMRKNIAKRYAEEVSAKLLLPMMLMFLAILIIVGTPAVLALRRI